MAKGLYSTEITFDTGMREEGRLLESRRCDVAGLLEYGHPRSVQARSDCGRWRERMSTVFVILGELRGNHDDEERWLS